MADPTDKIVESFMTAKSVFSAYGEADPFWSVLTDPKYRIESLSTEAVAEFYRTGEEYFGWCADLLARNGLLPPPEGTALDFGCGVGRVTLAIASRFRHVVGCDISEGHLAVAGKVAAAKGVSNVRFVATKLDLIQHFGESSMDFIHTVIVLQHMIPPLMKTYLTQFCRMLREGGVAFFQLPTRNDGYSFDEAELERSVRNRNIQLHVLPIQEVLDTIRACGCREMMIVPIDCVGPGWQSHAFVVKRNSTVRVGA